MKSFFGGENVPEMKKTGNPDELRAVLESMRLTDRKIAAFYSVGECVNLTRENIESEAYDMDGGIDGESREEFSGFENIPDSAKFPLEIITEEPFLTVFDDGSGVFLSARPPFFSAAKIENSEADFFGKTKPNADLNVLFGRFVGNEISEVGILTRANDFCVKNFAFEKKPFGEDFIAGIRLVLADGDILEVDGWYEFTAVKALDSNENPLKTEFSKLKTALR